MTQELITPLLGADGWDGVLGVSGVDGNIFNGSYYTSGFDKNSSDENVQKFVKNYTDKYKTEPNMFAAFAYECCICNDGCYGKSRNY